MESNTTASWPSSGEIIYNDTGGLMGHQTKATAGFREPHLHDGKLSNMYCEPITSTPLSIISGVISIAIITGNFLVILAIIKGPSKFRRPMYWLIIHLSTADLLVGLMLLWNYSLASLLDIHNTLTSLSILFGIWIVSACASLFGFLLLALDRYIQIFYKAFHRAYATKCTVGTAIFLSWTIPICMFFVPPITFQWNCAESCECRSDAYMYCNPITECSQILPPFKKTYTLYIAIYMTVVMPLPVFIYCLIYVKVRRRAQVIRHSSKRQDIRLIKTLSAIMLIFVITLAPSGVIIFIDYTVVSESKLLIDFSFYIFVLGFLNSLANPMLYMWRIPAIRVSIQKICPCARMSTKHLHTSRLKHSSAEMAEASPSLPMRTYPHLSPAENGIDTNRISKKEYNSRSIAAMVCLRQIKRGRYLSSQTSTPLSERSYNFNNMGLPEQHPLKDENANLNAPLAPSLSEGEITTEL